MEPYIYIHIQEAACLGFQEEDINRNIYILFKSLNQLLLVQWPIVPLHAYSEWTKIVGINSFIIIYILTRNGLKLEDIPIY